MSEISVALFLFFQAVTLIPGGPLPLPTFGCQADVCMVSSGPHDVFYPKVRGTWAPQGPVCFINGGNYSVNLQLSFLPRDNEAEGAILIEPQNPPFYVGAWGERGRFILGWKSGNAYSLQSGATVITAQKNECYVLKYHASAEATINPDPRATRMTIHRIP